MSHSFVTKFGLLSFASTALAAPWSYKDGHRSHHGTGTGYPTGTGAPFPAGNGSWPYGSGTGTGTGIIASTGLVYSTGYVTVTEAVTEGASATDVAAAGASTSSSCSTPTVSTTTTQILTLTVSPAPLNQLPSGLAGASTNAFWSVPSISTPLHFPRASSTPVAAALTSSSAKSAAPAASSPVTYSSSVEAAGFSHGDFSFPHGPRSSSTKTTTKTSAAPVPTTSSTSSTPAAPVVTSTTPTTTSATPTPYSAPAVSVPAVISSSISTPSIVIPSSSAAVVETTSSISIASKISTNDDSIAGTKRGLPYNDASLTNCFAGSKVSWAYNWASSADGLDTSNFEYVPQLWSDREDFVSVWVSNANQAISSGATHILGFNEPDLAEQANMLPDAAAVAYKTYITDVFGGSGVQLGSPAVTNGGGDMGLTWLSNFLNACTDCQVDFVAVHWYDSFSNIAYFQQHITQAHEQTGLPVWVTEFGTTDGDDDQIAGFLQQVMSWMDSQDFVQRYAYFMASDGKLNSGSEMSTYGTTYATY